MRVDMRERQSTALCASVSILLGLWLAGCEQSGKNTGDADWIQTPSEITPSPTPTPTNSPTPSPSPTNTPSPTPTPTPTSGQVYTGPADLAKYVNKFVDDAKIQGIDVLPDMKNPTLEVRIGSLDSYGASVIGLCETGSGRRRVTLDPDFWNSVSETQRELLMHHELGHCVLYRAHRTTVLSTGAYASVMYPIIMGSSTYLNDYDYYQEELFTYAASMPVGGGAQEVVHVCDHPHE